MTERSNHQGLRNEPPAGGTGLGLSIVKHLTQSFGGTVTVENVPDGGAKFSVILPAA